MKLHHTAVFTRMWTLVSTAVTSTPRNPLRANNISVAQLKRETGITDATLYTWRKQARTQGVPVPGDGKNPNQWSAGNKFAVLMETASMNSTELSESVVKKGSTLNKSNSGKLTSLQAVPSRQNLVRSWQPTGVMIKSVSRNWRKS